MKSYVIGIDYGTLSARAVLLSVSTGEELAEAVCSYSFGVMDSTLPSGKGLPPLFALQHPKDYTDALQNTVHEVLRKAKVDPMEIAALGIDFTSCTVLPVTEDGTPLCFLPEFADEPHAYAKLWKHHGAIAETEEFLRVAKERDEAWLSIYGGGLSSEMLFPKILETLRKAPEVYRTADRFTEAGDWLSYLLTGSITHGASFAGLKAFWNTEIGYPSKEYFAAVDPALADVIETKIRPNVKTATDACAGYLNEQGAKLTGLPVGTPLALPVIDAHAALPALNIAKEGELMLIIGTSSCHIINADSAISVPGSCGYVQNGMLPGCYTYEAGQAGVGDSFDWFVQNGVPASYAKEAEEQNIGIHALLRAKASVLSPGENHLLALDWFNGNRSIFKNDALSGMILGINLSTKPEEIYRALLEATAYGTRRIIEQYEAYGIKIHSICASGGIAQKDPLMMQIYADVTGREIRVSSATQAGARGSAIYASVAGGCFSDIFEAANHFALPDKTIYRPSENAKAVYDRLYREYCRLSDYFGAGENPVMEILTRGISHP